MEYTHQQRIRVITGIILCILLAALDQTVVVPAVPAIASDLHGFAHLSWVVTAYLLTSTATTPLYGRLSDQFGRRQTLIPAIVVFVLAALFCAVAQTLPQLILARALQGIGGGGLMAIAQAAIADVVSPRERGKYQAYMAGTWGVASTAGPVVGGWVTQHFSWRFIFWANLPLGIAALVLSQIGLSMLRETRPGGRIDFAGAALLTVAVAACLLGLSWGGHGNAWLSTRVIGAFGAGAVFTILLWRCEQRASTPLLPMRLFASGSFTRLVGVGFLTALLMFAGIFLLPLYFQLVFGANAAESGVEIMPYLISTTIGAYIAGQVARKIGRTRGLIMLGLAMASGGFLLLGMLPATVAVGLIVALCAALGAGLGLVLPSSLVAVQNAAARPDVGAATATLLLLRAMGGAFGATIAGAILAIGLGHRIVALGRTSRHFAASAPLAGAFHLAFLVAAAFGGLALLLCLRIEDVALRDTVATDPEPIGH